MAGKRPPVPRLLVEDAATVEKAEEARIELTGKVRRVLTKGEVNAALIEIALRHLDEVVDYLRHQ